LQVALLNEEMNQAIASFRVDSMEKILANELAAMDQEARKLQTNFAHTFLTTPISGIVTIVYKDMGESVQVGEPVLRVENDDVVFAVGQVLHRSLLRVDQSVTVRIRDLFAEGTSLDIPGTIKAVRGHDADNDEWEVVIECRNPVVGVSKVLPIYYQFDRDLSEIVVH
jgi:multidrug resistance efflux pump